MSLFPSLFLPMLWALDSLASPSHAPRRVVDASGPPPFSQEPSGPHMQRQRGSAPNEYLPDFAEDVRAAPSPLAPDSTSDMLHVHPRSLSDTPSSSSTTQPLLLGVLIGVIATLFVLGFGYILLRVHRRHQELISERRLRKWTRPAPSAPLEFRHLEHFSTSETHSHPGTPSISSSHSTARKLRVAHRRPDGSWAFTDADTPLTPITPWTAPDTHKPWNAPNTTKPWMSLNSSNSSHVDTASHASHPLSPTTPSSSSATAFSHEPELLEPLQDGWSTKTGPPPYASGAGVGYMVGYPPSPPPPVPALPSPMMQQEAARSAKARAGFKESSPRR